MVQRVATQVKQVPGAAYNLIGEDVHSRREDLEGVGHDQIAKAIEDHVDLHPLRGFACQSLLEGPTDLVVFPDICFEVHTLLSCINRRKHGIVEITPIIVDT